MSYETIAEARRGAVFVITLNRPDQLNTIVPPLPAELEDAVRRASRRPFSHRPAGCRTRFCAGFAFGGSFEEGTAR
jgi:enoyl-CoA hydratase